MSHAEILEKAIKRAEKNYWDFFDWKDADDFEWCMTSDEFGQPLLQINGLNDEFYFHPNLVIFNHSFAKALWGDTWPTEKYSNGNSKPMYAPWEHRLREMVIAADPIEYLGKHL